MLLSESKSYIRATRPGSDQPKNICRQIQVVKQLVVKFSPSSCFCLCLILNTRILNIYLFRAILNMKHVRQIFAYPDSVIRFIQTPFY